MPGMGRMEATHIIRQREKESGRHIPIIALTAHALANFRPAGSRSPRATVAHSYPLAAQLATHAEDCARVQVWPALRASDVITNCKSVCEVP